MPLITPVQSATSADALSAPSPLKRSRAFLDSLQTALWSRLLFGLILVAISSALIFPNLSYPRAIIFDETYFVPTSQRYINGIFFQEPHPPLGKMLIALGQRWMHPEAPSNAFIGVEKINSEWPADEDITGYRIVPAIFGILNPVLLFLILTVVLGRSLWAFGFSLFVAFDNALLVQSRASLMDSILIFFCFATVLAFAYANVKAPKSTRAFVLITAIWGVLQGAAANVKLTGFFVIVLAGLYFLQLLRAREFRRLIVFALVFGGTAAGTWLALWEVHFTVAHQLGTNEYEISEAHREILKGEYSPDPLTRFAIQLRDALNYSRNYENGVPRLNLGKPDEIGSPWFWWIWGGRTMDYRWETVDGSTYRYNYLVGNPVTWLASLLGVLTGTGLVLGDVLFRFLAPDERRWMYPLVLLYWAYMVPMMFILRVMYLYHYLPPLLVGLILFALILYQAHAISWAAKRDILLVAAILLLVGFWLIKPFTYAEPLTNEQFQQRNIWPAWDLRCVNCG